MSQRFKTYGDLANFIERLLSDQLENRWEIDDFESIPLATTERQPLWAVEMWRRAVVDVAGIKQPIPEGHWMHPDARPQLEKMAQVLRYLDENNK